MNLAFALKGIFMLAFICTLIKLTQDFQAVRWSFTEDWLWQLWQPWDAVQQHCKTTGLSGEALRQHTSYTYKISKIIIACFCTFKPKSEWAPPIQGSPCKINRRVGRVKTSAEVDVSFHTLWGILLDVDIVTCQTKHTATHVTHHCFVSCSRLFCLLFNSYLLA